MCGGTPDGCWAGGDGCVGDCEESLELSEEIQEVAELRLGLHFVVSMEPFVGAASLSRLFRRRMCCRLEDGVSGGVEETASGADWTWWSDLSGEVE
jgi:hypothetical protein